MSPDSAFATMLYDSRPGKNVFSSEVCRFMDVNIDHLPELVKCTDNVGGITEKAAAELGLAAGTPVFSGGGDGAVIGVGAGACKKGDTHVYWGTSGWVSTVLEKRKLSVTSMICSMVGASEKYFNCFAELETAGKCVEWAMNRFGITSYEELNEMLESVPAGSNGVMFTPWLHGNRNPFEDPNARGMFFNLGLETTVAEMMRAVVEGVCMHLRWQMTAMDKLTPTSNEIRFVGGGARTPAICQILSDVLHKRVYTVDSPHNVGSVGAAAIIATGLGVFNSIEDIGDSIPVSAAYTPCAMNSNVYNERFTVFQNLYKNNKKNFFKLNGKEVLV